MQDKRDSLNGCPTDRIMATVLGELESKAPDLLRLAQERDGAARLLKDLPAGFSPVVLAMLSRKMA
jgi:hypothetical protein